MYSIHISCVFYQSSCVDLIYDSICNKSRKKKSDKLDNTLNKTYFLFSTSLQAYHKIFLEQSPTHKVKQSKK